MRLHTQWILLAMYALAGACSPSSSSPSNRSPNSASQNSASQNSTSQPSHPQQVVDMASPVEGPFAALLNGNEEAVRKLAAGSHEEWIPLVEFLLDNPTATPA